MADITRTERVADSIVSCCTWPGLIGRMLDEGVRTASGTMRKRASALGGGVLVDEGLSRWEWGWEWE